MKGYLTGATQRPPAEIDGKEGDKVVKVANPAYEAWITADQQVLGFLMSTMAKEILTQVVNMETTSQVWTAITSLLSPQSRARALNTRLALATTRKGDLNLIDYVNKMKVLADEMAAAGKPLDDEDMTSYILAGVDDDYEPVVSSLVGRAEPATVAEVCSQLLSFESRAKLRQSASISSANSARRGGGRRGTYNNYNNSNRGCGNPCGRGDRGGFAGARGRGGNSGRNGKPRPICQLCGKPGHVVADCWHRYDENFISDGKTTAAASSYGVDTNWYMDTGATDHITGELEKMTTHEKYNGKEQIHTTSVAGYEESSS